MSTFTVFPAIDLRLGQVVRLKEGDPGRQTTFSTDPAEIAQKWLDAGAGWLHVVNLDGALDENDGRNHAALESILERALALAGKVQFGGGIRSLDRIEILLKLGVSRVILGTIAIEKPDLVAAAIREFGAQRTAVGIDARDGSVRVRGWQADSRVPAADLARRMQDLGVRTIVFTDISRDGLGGGLNIPSTLALAELSGLDVIASGGVRAIEDLIAAREAGLAGVIIGRALYEGTVDLKEALRISNQADRDTCPPTPPRYGDCSGGRCQAGTQRKSS